MWTYGFFNSIDGDRVYNADQMSHIFEGLITDGVYESVGNKLAVQPNNGMTIQVATGRGWFSKHWVNNDSEYLLALEASDVTLNRYCAVCIRVDETDGYREAVPYLKYGEYATNPVKPTMERSRYINEYCLAYVLIKAKATEITASDIEDARFNTEVCGWVTGLINQVSTDTLYTQWEAIFNGFMTEKVESFGQWVTSTQAGFNEWFSGLQIELDSETATRLTNALPTGATLTLPASNWVDYTQSVTVINMNTTKSVLVKGNEETLDLYKSSGVKCTGQQTNTLTFTCRAMPTEDVKADIIHMGV